jgi:dGTPase
VLTSLEARYPRFDGLNLTWETLEGVVKHNGPLVTARSKLGDLPVAIQEYAARHDLELHTWSGPEAQVAALADDIAYNNHDIDDGYRAGLFSIEELSELPFVGDVMRAARVEFPEISDERWMAESVRRLIGARIADMIAETRRRAADMKPKSAEDVRAAGHALIAFSPEMQAHEASLRRFLFERMYASPRVNHMMTRARSIVRALFDLYRQDPSVLPDVWRVRAENAVGEKEAARVICDYIAGMTDAFAIDEHRRLLKLDPWD